MTNKNDWKTALSVNTAAFTSERMKELNENDINIIELSNGNMAAFEDFKNSSYHFFDTAKNNGVVIRSVHLPFSPFSQIDPASEDKSVRERFISLQTELIKISAQRGVQIAVVHPSGEPYNQEKREEHLKYSLEAMSQLNNIAKNEGVLLAIENLPRSCILRNCDEIRRFKAEIPDIHFVFDSNHSLVDSNTDIIKTMGERIIATHISDYDFTDEKHLLPGEGKVIWQDILKALEEVNYNGPWTYELTNDRIITAKELKDNHIKLLNGDIN